MTTSGLPEGVDVHFLDGLTIVDQQVLPSWVTPADEWVFEGVTYDVFGFTGPTTQDSGRQLFNIFVRPRLVGPGPATV
jgi:hypothetical protein